MAAKKQMPKGMMPKGAKCPTCGKAMKDCSCGPKKRGK